MKTYKVFGLITILALMFAAIPVQAVQADSPVPIHLGPGSITSTSLATYGTTWGPANDYWFDLSAGMKVTIVGLNMSQVPYTGIWGWPPVPGEDGGSAQLWVLDGCGGFSRHDLTSAGKGGTWNAQGSPVGHDQGFRKYLVQNFTPDWVNHGSSQYNIEPWKGPRIAPGPNTDGNMGTPNPASDKFDLEYTYAPNGVNYTVSGRHRMYYAASWDEMSLSKPPWPAYQWQWNKAINNTASPDAAWLPFYDGPWTVPGFCGDAKLRMAFQNRGVLQSGYWTISWDDIVVEGTLGDHAGPVTSNVVMTPVFLNGPATLTATVDDTTTGGSNIASAEYSLNGGAWTPMSAVDGAFNAVVENVTADFTAVQISNNAACVRGTDALGNGGAETCQTFVVGYVFTGFFQPIDNFYVNLAKAGQAIPAKWRLTDYNDVPISDPASFVGLYSYPVSCTDFNGNPLDALEEYAPGSSGLQYHGDGYWQFNWKTPKTYAGTCRAMYVEFSGGTTSPTVNFQFK